MSTNIMIVGVGGQGTLLASRILGNALLELGCDVKVSEVHGMSQRGGSVVTYVKYGEKVYSPVICKGEADIILSFEQLETARWLPYLKKGGIIITSTQKISPVPVIIGTAVYPENIIEKIEEQDIKIIKVDSAAIARQAGNDKSANVVLIGAMSKYMNIDDKIIRNAVDSSVPPKTRDVNLKAYDAGRNIA